MQNVPLLPSHYSDCLSLSVCSFMRRRPIHLPPLAQGARRSSPIYPANRTRSNGQPRRIRCYRMCSLGSGPWCWDTTTQAASDDAPSQPRGWRGVLSFSFEVRVRQGRVTLPSKSLQGVRAPNRLPGLSRTIPFDPFREAGWYPRLTSGDRICRMMEGFTRLTCCQEE